MSTLHSYTRFVSTCITTASEADRISYERVTNIFRGALARTDKCHGQFAKYQSKTTIVNDKTQLYVQDVKNYVTAHVVLLTELQTQIDTDP